MDLTTRCPRCNTVFQASLADLQLRKGYIRCIQCAYIFDGYAEVVSESGKEPFLEQNNLQSDYDQDQEPAISRDYHLDVSSDNKYHHEPKISSEPDFSMVSTGRQDDTTDSFSINIDNNARVAQSDSFILEADPNRRRSQGSMYTRSEPFLQATGRLLSWFLLVLLVLLMVFQLAYIYRAQIAQNLSFTRPALEKYCDYLGCNVPYLRDIDSLVITRSALKLITPKDEDKDLDQDADKSDTKPTEQDSAGEIDSNQEKPEIRNYELQFNLRNLARQPQEWPTVVLNLKDSSGQIQIKRNLIPKDYLNNVTPAIPAQSETFVSLPVQLKGDAQVNGFHLDLFFP